MSGNDDGFRHERARLSAGPIHYREAGSGPPIVFVHGALVHGGLWTEAATELAASHRCIVPDWPMGSHPEAMEPQADLSPRAVAGLVSELLAALELEDATIVGNDSGGAVSQILVTEKPERVGRLVLTNCDCFEKFPPPAFKGLVVAARMPGGYRLLAQLLRSGAVRKLPIAYGTLTAEPIDDALLRSFVEPQLRDPGVLRDGRKFVAAMRPADTLAAARRIPALKLPALIAWGVEDRFFKLEDAHRLTATIPDSRIVEIAGSSTFVPLDKPRELAAAISAFVGDESRVGSRSQG